MARQPPHPAGRALGRARGLASHVSHARSPGPRIENGAIVRLLAHGRPNSWAVRPRQTNVRLPLRASNLASEQDDNTATTHGSGTFAWVRVVVNAVPVRGNSHAVVVENMLKGWVDLGLEDELHLVIRPDVDLDLPVTVTVHHVGQHPLSGIADRRNERARPPPVPPAPC